MSGEMQPQNDKSLSRQLADMTQERDAYKQANLTNAETIMLLQNRKYVPQTNDRHKAQQIYPERAHFDFSEKASMFVVYSSGHSIAETEDSEVADFICKAWNQQFDSHPSVAPGDAQREKRLEEWAYAPDALDSLAFELYGRKAKPREFIGGSDATILRDAANALARERESRKQAEEGAFHAGKIEGRRELMRELAEEANAPALSKPVQEPAERGSGK